MYIRLKHVVEVLNVHTYVIILVYFIFSRNADWWNGTVLCIRKNISFHVFIIQPFQQRQHGTVIYFAELILFYMYRYRYKRCFLLIQLFINLSQFNDSYAVIRELVLIVARITKSVQLCIRKYELEHLLRDQPSIYIGSDLVQSIPLVLQLYGIQHLL